MKLLNLHLLGCAPAQTPPPCPHGDEPGRFIIAAGGHSDAHGQVLQMILRIDTATGQSWKLNDVPLQGDLQGHLLTGWVLIDEAPAETAAALSQATILPQNSAA